MAQALAELAEEPGLWLPDDGLREVLPLHGLVAASHRGALSVEDEAFGLPAERRAERQRTAADAWEREATGGAAAYHLALVEGRPVAFARTVFTPHGG